MSIFKGSKSYHASDKIYGLITALPVLIILEKHQEPSTTAILLVFFTLVAIWLAESYSQYYVSAYTQKKMLSGKEIRAILSNEYAVVISSNLILLPFFLELLGIMSLAVAYNAAQFIGIFLLFIIGYRLAIHIERPLMQRFLFGFVSASIGLFIVILKDLVH